MKRPTFASAACLLAAAAWLDPAARAGDEPAVSFIKPRSGATVVGYNGIRLLVQAPAGSPVKRIDLFLDGGLLAKLTAPPWDAVWDAGDGTRRHELTAVLLLEDGRTARATSHTNAIRVDQIERVDLVSLYVVVRDRTGKYVSGLKQEDFLVREDGKPQTIERFSATYQPLRVGIVLDTSLSMEKNDKIVKARDAALDFTKVLLPADEGAVVTFNDEVHVAQPLTSNRDELAAAIGAVSASGGTSLYDAVWKTSKLLDHFDGRRVLVLLSDGRDESSSGLEPGSLHTLEEALDQAQRSSVMIFSIGLGSDLEKDYVRLWETRTGLSHVDPSTSLADVLRKMADSTGGRSEISVGPGRLRKVYEEIAEDLRHQYSIAYTSPNKTRDGKWRELQLQIPGRDLEVITRKGYYAPK